MYKKQNIMLLFIFILFIIGSFIVYNKFFYLPDYHVDVNQSDIKQITISMDGTKKKIARGDWNSIIKEFNNAKISRVRNLDVKHNLVVLFAYNDRSGRSLTFAINGDEIRVSRVLGEKKVDYIANNPEIENTAIRLFQKN